MNGQACQVDQVNQVEQAGHSSFHAWLGRTLRITLTDSRVFQGQFVAIDNKFNVLLRYSEALEGLQHHFIFTYYSYWPQVFRYRQHSPPILEKN
jgi:small nuclear ribonucleoprotein (snRNP)-like protein